MRYVFIVALMALVSCSKNPNNPVAPSTPNNPTTNTYYWSHFIPNWHAGDTLVGYVTDSALNAQGVFTDTIFTKSSNDTSYIIHKGKQFYIWTVSLDLGAATDTFKDNQSLYQNVVINDRLDTTNAISWSMFNSVAPHKYKDKMNNWEYQHQLIIMYDQNPKYDRFKAYLGHYQALNKKY